MYGKPTLFGIAVEFMSVQAGLWNFDGRQVGRESLTSLVSPVKQFGPDDEQAYIRGPLGMIYRPFHTTAESHCETQPYVTRNGQVVTWDGRLDNRNELLPQLEKELGADRSDIAIVAAGLSQWGCAFFSKILGDWTLCVWDEGEQHLILARDYIGIRPLFYAAQPNRLVWCSHLAALAQPGGRLALCHEYCEQYLTYYPQPYLTPYCEIRAVPPASFVCLRRGTASTSTYWHLRRGNKIRYQKDEDYEDHFQLLLRSAVRRRLRADAPILAGLSGGFDSSSIVCLADDITRTENVSLPAVDTFSFCDREEPDEDDFLYFTKVEEKRGRPGYHAELHAIGESLSFSEARHSTIPGFGERLELKRARSEVLAQGGYRVLLSGRGGDEFSGQTLDSRVLLAEMLLRGKVVALGGEAIKWSLVTRNPLLQILFKTILLASGAGAGRRMIEKSWINSSLSEKTSRGSHDASVRAPFWHPGFLDAVQTYDSMARQMSCCPPSTQEVRYPFLDRELVEFLTAIPLEQLLRPGERRSLTRRALRNVLPPEILSRRTKAGAGRCVTLTIAKRWQELQSILECPLSAALGLTDASGLQQAFAAVKNGQIPTYIIQLLRALALEFWLRGAVERNLITLPSLNTRSLKSRLNAETETSQRGEALHRV